MEKMEIRIKTKKGKRKGGKAMKIKVKNEYSSLGLIHTKWPPEVFPPQPTKYGNKKQNTAALISNFTSFYVLLSAGSPGPQCNRKIMKLG